VIEEHKIVQGIRGRNADHPADDTGHE
jgi:hypothetical protein